MDVKNKNCVVCDTEFRPRSGIHKFCSVVCKGKWKYLTEQVTTSTQYKKISGNWKRYFSRLMYYGGRKRDQLTREILLEKLEQQKGLCALSGVPLTCTLTKGTVTWTNASVDRIEAGGPYTEDNIQLVCRGLNSWRSSIPVDEFVWWCRQVVQHSERESEG